MHQNEFSNPPTRDRCPYNCLTPYSYVATDCPLELCSVCTNIANLDTEIYGVHDQLGELLQKRREMERNVNVCHDIFIHRFPVEIMIIIFHFFDVSNERGLMTSPLILGAVCERWRDITLSTPWIWDTAVIHPLRDSAQLDVVKEWLRRSQSAPLTLTVQYKYAVSATCPPFEDLISVLRSHSSRWKALKLLVPSSMIHGLLHNLEDVPNIVRLRMDIPHEDKMENIFMREPLRPKTFHAKRTSIQQGILKWDNLTRLDVAAIKLDELIHIIRHGIHLTECTATYIARYGGTFLLPTAPFIHKSLKYIKTTSSHITSNFLQYLTLPFLRNLHYDFISENDWTAIPTLNAFLDRSDPPLHKFAFTFNVDPQHNQHGDWAPLRSLPRITHLALDIEHHYRSDMTTALFYRLNDSSDMYLPHLRELKLTTPNMTHEGWYQFDKFFAGKDSPNEPNDPGGGIHTPLTDASLPALPSIAQRHTRPLESVIIHLKECFDDNVAEMMDAYVPHLLKAEKSGVYLELMDFLGFDMLHRA